MTLVTSRTTTLGQHLKMMETIASTQNNLSTLQQQISSGRKASDYQGMAGQVEFVGIMDNKIRLADQYLNSNETVLSRLKTMGESVKSTISIVTETRQLITISRGSSISEKGALMQQAKALMARLSDQLNANLGGRYLFSGTKTDTRPVPDAIPENITLGVPDDAYYSGDNEVLSSRISDSFNMQYGITANDPAFQKLITAINLTHNAINNRDFDNLGKAMDIAGTALDGINAIQSNINNNIININNANASQKHLKIYWQNLSSEITETDIVSATARLQVDNAVLQATYQSFARISSIKLSDYLR